MLTDEQKQRLYDLITHKISCVTRNKVGGFESAEDVDDAHPVCIDVLGESNRYRYFITVDFAKFAVTEVVFDDTDERATELEYAETCRKEINDLVSGIQWALDWFKDEIER